MTLLVDHQIVTAIENGNVIIKPFDKALIQPSSIDLRLSNSFIYDPDGPNEQEMILDKYLLQPKEFALGCTMEYVQLGRRYTGEIVGKSTIGRKGRFIENAGHVDPGFRGQITLEFFNATDRPALLKAGEPICQMLIHRHAACQRNYVQKGGHYVDQRGATRGI